MYAKYTKGVSVGTQTECRFAAWPLDSHVDAANLQLCDLDLLRFSEI